MAGIIDKKNIKKINSEIVKFTNKIANDNIDADLLKGILGKDGILVRSCKLGNNRNTKFHELAAKCRKEYKGRKFISINKYTDNLLKNYNEAQEDYKDIVNIKNKILKLKVKILSKVHQKLEEKVNKLTKLSNIHRAFPDASPGDFKRYILEVPEASEQNVKTELEAHNKLVNNTATEKETLLALDALSEDSNFSQWVNDIGTGFLENTKKTVKYSSQLGSVAGPIAFVLSIPENVAWGTVKAVLISVFGGAYYGISAILGKKHRNLIQLKKLAKQLIDRVKNLGSSQDALKHSAHYVLKDSEERQALGKQLVESSQKMDDALTNEPGRIKNLIKKSAKLKMLELKLKVEKSKQKKYAKKGQNDKVVDECQKKINELEKDKKEFIKQVETEMKADSPIRACRRSVANLLEALGKKLNSEGEQPNLN